MRLIKLLNLFINFIVIFTFPIIVSASSIDYLVNSNNVKMTYEEYNNLLNLGFTEQEIMNMNIDEFINNKDLKGEIVGTEVKYYINTKKYWVNGYIVSSGDAEITEDMYNNSSFIMSRGMTPGYTEISSRKITTTIIAVSNMYRYKITVEWKNIPSVKSNDIMGIGIDSSVYIHSDIYFQQNYCYTDGSCYSNMISYPKISSTGGAVSFQLPSYGNLSSLSSYMYFTIDKKNTSTISQLYAYGDYSHATSAISSDNAKNYSITRAGIILNSSILNYYDAIPVTKATWTGSW